MEFMESISRIPWEGNPGRIRTTSWNPVGRTRAGSEVELHGRFALRVEARPLASKEEEMGAGERKWEVGVGVGGWGSSPGALLALGVGRRWARFLPGRGIGDYGQLLTIGAADAARSPQPAGAPLSAVRCGCGLAKNRE
jgi:hypothetical protein